MYYLLKPAGKPYSNTFIISGVQNLTSLRSQSSALDTIMATPATGAQIDSPRNPNHVQPSEGPRPGRRDECPTCQQSLINNNTPNSVQPLEMHEPCGAVFHHSCLEPWLRNNSSCPWCRGTVRYPDNDEPIEEVVNQDTFSVSWQSHVLQLTLVEIRPMVNNFNLNHQQITSCLNGVTDILQQIR